MRSIFRLISIILSGFLFATGTQFLTIPSNGLELSIGSNTVYKNSINPASITANKSGLFLDMSHGSWLADSKISSLLMLFPGDKVHFGVNLKYVEIDDLELRGETPTDEPLATYGANGFALGAVGSWDMLGMKIGAAFRWVRINLYTENSNGFSVDIGLIKQLSSKLKVGAAILNMGKMSILKSEEPKLPNRALASASYLFSAREFSNEFTLGGEISTLVNGFILHTSNETNWHNLTLRQSSKLSKEVTEISFGAGFRFGIYNLNYGILIGSHGLGIPQMFDLTIYFP